MVKSSHIRSLPVPHDPIGYFLLPTPEHPLNSEFVFQGDRRPFGIRKKKKDLNNFFSES